MKQSKSRGVLKMALTILLAVVIAALAYVRLAPNTAERWHVDLPPAKLQTSNQALRVIEGDAARLARLADALEGLPRTERLAGSAAEGHITFVTRSLVVGYPDYVTLQLQGDEILLFSRSRFGRSDLGVNGARLDHILKATQAGAQGS